MTQKNLHPSVLQFKEFVKNNPKIIQEVRKGKSTWQELYEDWYLLGEDDSRWETIGTVNESGSESNTESNTDSKGDWMSNIFGMVKNMDPNQMQNHINNLSQAIGAIQSVISQFQVNNPSAGPAKTSEGPKHPFVFRKD